MAEMVGPELRLEPVGGLAERAAMTPALAMTRSNGAPWSTSALAQARTLSSDAKIEFGQLKTRRRSRRPLARLR